MIMLDVDNLMQKVSLMMVIDEGYCAGDFSVLFQIFLQQFLADQITNRFGAIRVFAFLDQAVKIMKQCFF